MTLSSTTRLVSRSMNRSAWCCLCAILLILSDLLGTAWAKPPRSNPPPLTAAELHQAEQICAGLLGTPLGAIEYSHGATKCARLRPLLPYMADSQGDHADTIGLSPTWNDGFYLRGGLEVTLIAIWFDERFHEIPQNRAPIVQVMVHRKDGKKIFSVTRAGSSPE